MSSPLGREPKLEGDIVTTKAWITMDDSRIGVCFSKFELPRNEEGWGQIGKGWRITLPTGEQGLVTEFYDRWCGVVAELDVGHELPLMRARMHRSKSKHAPRVKVTVERLDSNVIVLPPRVAPQMFNEDQDRETGGPP